MDAARFDALAKSLTDAHSRRGALGGLLAGALGVLGVRSEEAEAHDPRKKCKKKSGDAKKKCLKKAKKHNAQHAAEATVPPPPCVGQPDGTNCPGGGFCQGGVCACPVGMRLCGTCVNTQTSTAHCGSCGVVCTQYKTCCQGTCKNPNGTPECCLGSGEVCTPDGGITFGAYVCCSKSCDTGVGKSNRCV